MRNGRTGHSCPVAIIGDSKPAPAIANADSGVRMSTSLQRLPGGDARTLDRRAHLALFPLGFINPFRGPWCDGQRNQSLATVALQVDCGARQARVTQGKKRFARVCVAP